MPLYMDLHKLDGQSPEDVALAHLQDIETHSGVQGRSR
jgi:hypothetical protein